MDALVEAPEISPVCWDLVADVKVPLRILQHWKSYLDGGEICKEMSSRIFCLLAGSWPRGPSNSVLLAGLRV